MAATGYTGGGGGGGVTPSNTVVSETSFGQTPNDGSSITYSRGDHTHGTPAAPSSGIPAISVVSETTFGQSTAVGASTNYARQDHTHGTPTAPTAASVGAATTVHSHVESDITSLVSDLALKAPLASPTFTGTPTASTAVAGTSTTQLATTAFATTADGLLIAKSLVDAKGDILTATANDVPARFAVGADGLFLKADSTQTTGLIWAAPGVTGGGGTGRLKTIFQTFLTTGDVSVLNGPGFTVLGSDLTIPALTGDILAVDIEAMCATAGSDVQFEACTRVSAANLNFWSSGTATSRNPGGIAAWYCSSGFVGPRTRSYYTVQSGDVVGGNVTVRILAFGSGGSRTINANASYPFRWALSNVGT